MYQPKGAYPATGYFGESTGPHRHQGPCPHRVWEVNPGVSLSQRSVIPLMGDRQSLRFLNLAVRMCLVPGSMKTPACCLPNVQEVYNQWGIGDAIPYPKVESKSNPNPPSAPALLQTPRGGEQSTKNLETGRCGRVWSAPGPRSWGRGFQNPPPVSGEKPSHICPTEPTSLHAQNINSKQK